MSSVIVCAGGPVEEMIDLTKFTENHTLFIGADKGTLHLLDAGIVPVEAVGDFDSVSSEEYEKIRSKVKKIDAYRSEKNETDTELAVERALTYVPKEVVLTGVTGGRLDHMLSALHLLYRMQKKNPDVSFKICNAHNEFIIFLPGAHKITYHKELQYISFFAFQNTVSALTLRGFKYETDREKLEIGMTKFTSNELLKKEGHILFEEGICLMVRSSDA